MLYQLFHNIAEDASLKWMILCSLWTLSAPLDDEEVYEEAAFIANEAQETVQLAGYPPEKVQMYPFMLRSLLDDAAGKGWYFGRYKLN